MNMWFTMAAMTLQRSIEEKTNKMAILTVLGGNYYNHNLTEPHTLEPCLCARYPAFEWHYAKGNQLDGKYLDGFLVFSTDQDTNNIVVLQVTTSMDGFMPKVVINLLQHGQIIQTPAQFD
jgi:hypothetical protein